MEIRYFGHSALQVEAATATLLVDPFIRDNPSARSVVTVEDLRPDVILLTHAHGDHFGDTPEIAKASDAMVVANPEICEYLVRVHAYGNVFGMNIGGRFGFEWGSVEMTHALHSSSFPDGTYGGNPSGLVLNIDGKTIYVAGDTALFSEMAWIGDEHEIDVAFLPIGDTYTMGPDAAIRAASMLRPGLTVPVHYNTFPEIRADAEEWARRMEAEGHPARVLAPGQILVI